MSDVDEQSDSRAARLARYRPAQCDSRRPWRVELRPNDRDRELALRTVAECNRGDCSMPALITSFAHALAAYRVELTAQPTADTGKVLRAHDHD